MVDTEISTTDGEQTMEDIEELVTAIRATTGTMATIIGAAATMATATEAVATMTTATVAAATMATATVAVATMAIALATTVTKTVERMFEEVALAKPLVTAVMRTAAAVIATHLLTISGQRPFLLATVVQTPITQAQATARHAISGQVALEAVQGTIASALEAALGVIASALEAALGVGTVAVA